MFKRLLLAVMLFPSLAANFTVKHNTQAPEGDHPHVYYAQGETVYLVSVEDVMWWIKSCHPTQAGYEYMLDQLRKPQFAHNDSKGNFTIGSILTEETDGYHIKFTCPSHTTYGITKEGLAAAVWLEERLNSQAFKERFVTEIKLLKGDLLSWDSSKYLLRK